MAFAVAICFSNALVIRLYGRLPEDGVEVWKTQIDDDFRGGREVVEERDPGNHVDW